MSATVELRGVAKRFGAVVAVDDVSLTVQAGEFLTLLGPSGCGKTTLLRMIAGFETPDRGAVLISGADVTHTPSHRRDVNQVFQSYALFPHLSVRGNIAFGLRMQRLAAGEVEQRVAEMLAVVALEGCEERKPHELSGGQRQRVALARALAPRPAVLLLDEPLSALDARLRQTMQLELKRLQRRVGTTFVLVTHDQAEALAMSDRVALVHRGRIEQVGTAAEIYDRPATAFAAEFIGQANVLEAEFIGRGAGGVDLRVNGVGELRVAAAAWLGDAPRARIVIRPERIRLEATQPAKGMRNAFPARVEEKIFQGAQDRLTLVTPGGLRLVATAANAGTGEGSLRVGDSVWCAVYPEDVVILRQPASGEAGRRAQEIPGGPGSAEPGYETGGRASAQGAS
ncbi:MAG: ABC transporter ATP-binding protein [Opitutaceae bacterium]|nr:ABC transporter ATP-binding protein [Opitutaceae bacterium]